MAVGRSGLRLHRSLFLAGPRMEGAIARKHRLIPAFRVYTGWTSGKPSDSLKAGRNSSSPISGTSWYGHRRGRHHHGSRKIYGLCGSAGYCRSGRHNLLSDNRYGALAGGLSPSRRSNSDLRRRTAVHAPFPGVWCVPTPRPHEAGTASEPAKATVRQANCPCDALDTAKLGTGGRRHPCRGGKLWASNCLLQQQWR